MQKDLYTCFFETKDVSEDGSFTGYGSVFDVVDGHKEVVAKGAFKKSIREHKRGGTMPALLWQHDASTPIGVYTEMKEDDRGLLLKGQINLDVQKGKEAHSLLKQGALNGLSIGFVPKTWETDSKKGIRTLTAVDLWEVSVVTFPSNPASRIASVKSVLEQGEMPTVREFEKALTQDLGFTRSQAIAIINDGFKSLAKLDAGEHEVKRDADADITNTLEKLLLKLKA